ncbi:calcium-binding protein [Okeania sp. KiyG1]|uniref:calcium-binding protein n=1 Tax=Okeania sp. KiyG1 TaxID=2720165 RepID=UPI0019241654|nr:calcium-binding protein [Okeania sp. KiyG1]GGA49885.1 hypothetical protein CYANOKiyG1_69140 [Okeania sp. KiyG1]
MALVQGTNKKDNLKGTAKKDTINGKGGNDQINGRGGNDKLNGNGGSDKLNGGAGKDTLNGGSGQDTLNGGSGRDSLIGGSGNDFLDGGKGNDILTGNPGNDVLVGNFGKDTLTGGAGDDVFFLKQNSAVNRKSAADIITDFKPNFDMIGLDSGLTENDLNLQLSGNSTVIKVKKTGKILGVVRGVKPKDLKWNFTSVDGKPNVIENLVTFKAPTVKQKSSDTYEMKLTGSNKSNFVITIKNTGTEAYQESVRYTPSPSERRKGNKPFTAEVNSEGSRIELQFDGSSDVYIFDNQRDENTVDVIKKTPTGETKIAEAPIDPEIKSSIEESVVQSALCKAGQNICKGVGIMGDVASGLAAATALTGVGASASAAFGAVALGAKAFGYGCLMLYGNDFDLGISLIDEGLGGIFSLTKSQFKNSYNFITSILKTAGLIENSKDSDGLMQKIRKRLGIDWCDIEKKEVRVYFQPHGNPWTLSNLYLVSPEEKFIGTAPNSFGGLGNSADAQWRSIGTFPVGTELEFETRVEGPLDKSGSTNFAGNLTLNSKFPDSASIEVTSSGLAWLGFEDGSSGTWLGVQVETPNDFNDTLVNIDNVMSEGNRIFVA